MSSQYGSIHGDAHDEHIHAPNAGGSHAHVDTKSLQPHPHHHDHRYHDHTNVDDDDGDVDNTEDSSHSSSWCGCVNPSHRYFHWYILTLACFIPFGAHIVKYSLSSLGPEMMSDPTFPLDHTQFGWFASAVSISNSFIPIFGGFLLDMYGTPQVGILLLTITIAGHAAFVFAVQNASFWAAVAARIVFGLGQGSTVVVQGRIIARWFRGRELVFAVAMTEVNHNACNVIAKLYTIPVSEYASQHPQIFQMQGYVVSLWVGVGLCGISLISGILFYIASRNNQEYHEKHEEEYHHHVHVIATEPEPEQPTSVTVVTDASTDGTKPIATFVTSRPALSSITTAATSTTTSTSAPPSMHVQTVDGVTPRTHARSIQHMHHSHHSAPDGPSLKPRHGRIRSVAQLVRRSEVQRRRAACHRHFRQQQPQQQTLQQQQHQQQEAAAPSTETTPLLIVPASSSTLPSSSPSLSDSHSVTGLSSLQFDQFTWRFILLCVLHMVFSNMNHCFGYVSGDLLKDKFNSTVNKAAWMSSITYVFAMFVCPLASLYLDRVGYKMYVCAACAVCSGIAFSILALSDMEVYAICALILLAVAVAIVPTMLRAAVPAVVHSSVYGIAYGVYEISEGLGAVAGHGLVGFVRDKSHGYDIDLLLFIGMAAVAFGCSIMLSWLDKWAGGTINAPSIDRHHHADGHGHDGDMLHKKADSYSYPAAAIPIQ